MSEIPETLGLANLDLTREARMVAYLALKALGKVKADTLPKADRVRDAILADCDIDTKTGAVTWKAGTVACRDREDLQFLAKQVTKLIDDEGVDIDLAKSALELRAKIEERLDEVKAIEKAAKAATEKAKT